MSPNLQIFKIQTHWGKGIDTLIEGRLYNRGLTVFLSPKWRGSRMRCRVWLRNIDRTCFEFCTLAAIGAAAKASPCNPPHWSDYRHVVFTYDFNETKSQRCDWYLLVVFYILCPGNILQKSWNNALLKLSWNNALLKLRKSLRNTTSDCDQWGKRHNAQFIEQYNWKTKYSLTTSNQTEWACQDSQNKELLNKKSFFRTAIVNGLTQNRKALCSTMQSLAKSSGMACETWMTRSPQKDPCIFVVLHQEHSREHFKWPPKNSLRHLRGLNATASTPRHTIAKLQDKKQLK